MRVLAALSGGVDRAVAAARLLREGAEVVGVHLRTGVEAEGGAAGGRSCCGLEDARDARGVAARLGIPFYVVDARRSFAAVLDEFVASYAAGRTPNPCITCNDRVKFGRLREVASDLGCEAVATGHYARRVVRPDGRVRLLRAIDARKDQTYVLYRLDAAQLRDARFPLGETRKDDVRAEAAALGLAVAGKPDSQDLCFLPEGGVGAFLRAAAPAALRPGPFLAPDGRVLGRHDGAAAFTVGQRRGLPPLGAPFHVAAVDAPAGVVRLAPRGALLRRDVDVEAACWIDEEPPPAGRRERVEARVRHAAPLAPAWLEATGPGRLRVTFDDPVFAATPGQALVAYRDDAVLAGGTIRGP